jgi:hypothetical protein
MVEVSDQQEERLERKILDRISNTCAFSAIVSNTDNEAQTPDVICVQDKKYKEYTRLIESDYDGEVTEDKRDQLYRLSKDSGENIKVEVHFRPSPRKVTGRTVKKEGWSNEKVKSKLKEFKEPHENWQ